MKNGLSTSGKVKTDSRLQWFHEFEFTGKSVLDIGCNSGQYSLYAKKAGASSVTGIDVDEKRINEARILALNEDLDVDFKVGGVEQVNDLGKFDIVICIAVVTEVENVLGALRAIRDVTNETAIMEMGLARPMVYASANRRWWKKDHKLSRRSKVAEMHRHQHAGWVCFPSLPVVSDLFGEDFEVSAMGEGLRYHKVVVRRK